MSRKDKILVIGYGSIGQRRYAILRDLGYQNVYVYDPKNPSVNERKIHALKTLKANRMKEFRCCFVCSPNHLHVRHSLLCASLGLDLFVEKPLSHSMGGVEQLIRVSKRRSLVTMVACNTRFHPNIAFIKRYIDAGSLGKVYAIHHDFGFYLPKWRPQQDYRANYAAHAKQGGGVTLDDIHEFDLLFWLKGFMRIKEHSVLRTHVSDLKIDTEDVSVAQYKFKDDSIGTVRADYLRRQYDRRLVVVGEKGTLYWDFTNATVMIRSDNRTAVIHAAKGFTNNNMYVEEIRYFLKQVRQRKQTFNSLERAAFTLKNCI